MRVITHHPVVTVNRGNVSVRACPGGARPDRDRPDGGPWRSRVSTAGHVGGHGPAGAIVDDLGVDVLARRRTQWRGIAWTENSI